MIKLLYWDKNDKAFYCLDDCVKGDASIGLDNEVDRRKNKLKSEQMKKYKRWNELKDDEKLGVVALVSGLIVVSVMGVYSAITLCPF